MPNSVSKKSKDLVLVHGPLPGGNGVSVLRAREQTLELGTMRPLEQGKPIHGEVVKLTPRPDVPMLFDAETQLEATTTTTEPQDVAASTPRGATAGPAQVASESYRKNWDAIWKRSPKGLAN